MNGEALAIFFDGRPLDGAGIILLQRLAVAFKTAGERVSAADRSKFVRVIEALDDDQHLGFSDVRQKVMDTLKVTLHRR